MHAAAPIVFFLFAVCWGFGYAGVTMQYGIIAKDVFPTDLRGPAFAGVSCAAMIAMEMARKAEHEKLIDTATAEGIGTLSDHATEMAV
jgi:hypothetical protein